MFTHDAKDLITVGAFTATLDDFLLLEPSYRLPDGAIWQFYSPGIKHLIGYGLYQRDGGTTWSDGDVYLSNETEYATMQPDTSPDVAGFEADLVAAFGGDYQAINGLYSGWPLFKDAIESAQWSVADLLLTDSYVHYEITTDTYTAIIAAARANYIPMALQGRPGLMPLNITDYAYPPVIIIPGPNQADSLTVVASEIASYLVPLPSATDSATIQIGAETAALVLPISILSGDSVDLHPTEGVPVIV